jgi:hypothetical protein
LDFDEIIIIEPNDSKIIYENLSDIIINEEELVHYKDNFIYKEYFPFFKV